MAKTLRKKPEQKNNYFKFIKWFWILFGVGVLSIVLVFLLASWGAFGEMPTFERLENPETNLATEFLSSDGETLGKLYLDDNRTWVDYETLPENLVQALIATEDARYYSHSGIDARGFLRALVFLGTRGGASTITQQLSRQLFVGVRSNNLLEVATQKIKEWVIATQLERNYTKDEIVATVERGIIAETYTNGQVQIGAGDYTFYVKNGWLVEKGRITAPVKDVNIIGNGPESLKRITMVANDARLDTGGWTCGKNGQRVPVSQGIPTVLVSNMTVGGENAA